MKNFYQNNQLNPVIFFTLGLFLLLFAFKQKNINITIKKYWLPADTKKNFGPKNTLAHNTFLFSINTWWWNGKSKLMMSVEVLMTHLVWMSNLQFCTSCLKIQHSRWSKQGLYKRTIAKQLPGFAHRYVAGE